MKNARGIVAAHVNERTQELWDEFREHARTRGLSNTRALEQAAALWVGHSVEFPLPDKTAFVIVGGHRVPADLVRGMNEEQRWVFRSLLSELPTADAGEPPTGISRLNNPWV